MNYLDAKSVLLKPPSRMPLRVFAIEAAALVGIAGVLVRFFA